MIRLGNPCSYFTRSATQTHIAAAKFYSSQAHDMDTVEPPRGAYLRCQNAFLM